jgi:hypothetical protein
MMKASAEVNFRKAFERLKAGDTLIIPAGSAVTQNNVAREASRDPSAFRKSRYPELIGEIQEWVGNAANTPVVTPSLPSSQVNSKLEAVMLEAGALREERDLLLSKLLVANDRILLLTSKIREGDEPGKGSAPIVFT